MIKLCLYLSAAFSLLHGLGFSQRLSIGIKSGVSHTDITGRFDYKNFNGAEITYNNLTVFGQKVPRGTKKSSGFLKPTSGFVINYKINNSTSLHSELNYEERGFDFHYTLYGGGVEGYYKMHYISIPCMFMYDIGKKIKYYGYGGLSFNALLKAKNFTLTQVTIQNGYIPKDESYIPTEFNKQIVGALAGLGIKIPIDEKVKFVIDARYDIGITKAAKNTIYIYDPTIYTPDTPNNFQDVFNRSLTLSWGVIFKVGKDKQE